MPVFALFRTSVFRTVGAYRTIAIQYGPRGMGGVVPRGGVVPLHRALATSQAPPAQEAVTKTHKVFVHMLPFATTKDELQSFMEEHVGPVAHAEMIKSRDGKSKGSGSVAFNDQAAAEKAVRELNMQLFGGTKILVQPDYRGKSVQLYLGNLPPFFGWDQIRELFKPFGGVWQVHLAKRQPVDVSWCTVVMCDEDQAQAAMDHFATVPLSSGHLVLKMWDDRPASARVQDLPRKALERIRSLL